MSLDGKPETTHTENRKKVRLVLGKASSFKDVRCDECGALLYRELVKSLPITRVIEIKCKRCGTMKVN